MERYVASLPEVQVVFVRKEYHVWYTWHNVAGTIFKILNLFVDIFWTFLFYFTASIFISYPSISIPNAVPTSTISRTVQAPLAAASYPTFTIATNTTTTNINELPVGMD